MNTTYKRMMAVLLDGSAEDADSLLKQIIEERDRYREALKLIMLDTSRITDAVRLAREALEPQQ